MARLRLTTEDGIPAAEAPTRVKLLGRWSSGYLDVVTCKDHVTYCGPDEIPMTDRRWTRGSGEMMDFPPEVVWVIEETTE